MKIKKGLWLAQITIGWTKALTVPCDAGSEEEVKAIIEQMFKTKPVKKYKIELIAEVKGLTRFIKENKN